MTAPSPFAEIEALMVDYFDGLHFSDADRLARVLHPDALYASATEGSLVRLDMAAYLPMVAARPSPAGRGEARRDRIVSIRLAGPVTAFVHAECAIGPKRFTDFLTLLRVDGRWSVVAKVFHFDLEAA